MAPPNLFLPSAPCQKGPERLAPGLIRVVLGLLAEKEREGFNLLTQDGQATEQERATHWI
jgi:hypothetical protein